MASNHKKQKNRPVQKPSRPVAPPPSVKASPKTSSPGQKTLWSVLDGFFGKHLNVILVLSIVLSAILGGFLFDVKISTGGDDSHYVEMAYDFLKGKAFPSWHGPLYSVFLSLPILIFGVNIIWLKIFSFLFILAHLVLFFYTFRKHVSPTILTLILLILAVN